MDTTGNLVAGATGLVGHALLDTLLATPGGTVHALVRRPTAGLAGRTGLQVHQVDYQAPGLGLARWPTASEAYCALGTTIGVAGSQAAFRAVDFDAVLAFARAAQAAGVQRLAVVSALGADAASRVFYNRVKGEAEEALAGLGLSRLVLGRPSLLAGPREALGQPRRWGERLALAATAPLAWALPARVRPIAATTVARALVAALRAEGPALQVLESADLARLGR